MWALPPPAVDGGGCQHVGYTLRGGRKRKTSGFTPSEKAGFKPRRHLGADRVQPQKSRHHVRATHEGHQPPPRDTCSPTGLRHRRAPTRAAPQTRALQQRKRSAFGGARANALPILRCRIFNILPVSGAPTESHNLHLPRRLPRAQVAGKAAKSMPRREIFGRRGGAFWGDNAPGGRGAAVSAQQAQNRAAGWLLRAKPCHGHDDAHVSCQARAAQRQPMAASPSQRDPQTPTAPLHPGKILGSHGKSSGVGRSWDFPLPTPHRPVFVQPPSTINSIHQLKAISSPSLPKG